MILLLADAKSCVTRSILSGGDQSIKFFLTGTPAFSSSLEDALKKEDLELAIIECHMHERTCLSLISIIKKRRIDVPVLFVMSAVTDNAVAEAFKRGARDCFKNPFDLRVFQETVNKIRAFRRSPGEQRLPLPPSESGTGHNQRLSSNLPDGIIRVIQYLEERIAEQDLYLERLARIAGMSPFHFCRTFKRTMGQTPMQYILRLRIERVKNLLQFHARRMTVSQIATSLGFYDSSSLNKHFKRITGLTPTAFVHMNNRTD